MIELLNLTKIYHSEKEGSLALRGITITFPETGFVAVTGESGSGKTTLLNVLSGFVSYEEGSLKVDGVDFTSLSKEELEAYRKNDIGFIFQDYHLIEGHTVLDNLLEALYIMGIDKKTAKKKALDYLTKYDLIEHKNNKARELSSGQKQKLAIARALIKEPKVVLCDEPTANLDIESGKAIFGYLKEYSKDHLVIVSTHNYEDAKDFVTHFVRLYKGNLTAFETIEETKVVPEAKQTNDKADFVRLSLTNLKNQSLLNVVKAFFSAILVFVSIFMLALFSGNVDDSFTKIVSRSVFNNVAQDQLLIMKKSGEFINQEDLMSVESLDHVRGTQLYGMATEMNYYYRPDIDYGYYLEIVKTEIVDEGGGTTVDEHTEYVFKTLHDDLYIKSYDGMVDESYLSSGTMPVDFYDVVVYGDYSIGDTLTVYFADRVLQGFNYFQFDFKVVGLLSEPSEDLYFSNEFIRNIDYIQYYSNHLPFNMMVNYRYYDTRSRSWKYSYVFCDFSPIYNPNIGDNEVLLSSKFLANAGDGFPDRESMTSTTVSFLNNPGRSCYFDFAEQYSSDELPAFCVYVGKGLYNDFMKNYQSKISRVVIDNYANLDDVVSSLTKLKYDCLSEYRSASTNYDSAKRDQRALTLIVSLMTLIAVFIIYYVFGFLLEKNRLSIDRTLQLLGASKGSIYRSSIIQISIVHIIGLILGIALYLVSLTLPIAFLQATNLYLRFYHFLIVSGFVVVLIGLLWLKYRQDFLRLENKGGNF